MIILVLWNKKFNYYKDQPLDIATEKDKLKVMLFSGTKMMKSKTKDINVEIELAMLDQILFLGCMYMIMCAAKKEEHA